MLALKGYMVGSVRATDHFSHSATCASSPVIPTKALCGPWQDPPSILSSTPALFEGTESRNILFEPLSATSSLGLSRLQNPRRASHGVRRWLGVVQHELPWLHCVHPYPLLGSRSDRVGLAPAITRPYHAGRSSRSCISACAHDASALTAFHFHCGI
jgi:hypothetical protein